jgi:YfiH family protein
VSARAPADFRVAAERDTDPGLPLRSNLEWSERWPWLTQGTTWRGADGTFDLGLFGRQPVGEVLARWRLLQDALGVHGIVHSRQVHGAGIRVHEQATPGFTLLDGFDGHYTAEPGFALTVSIADCVPVSIIDPDARTATLLHAGWRGVAAGIIERGIALAAERGAGDTALLHVHFGPAICGRCYEVGPEVHERLGLDVPDGPLPVDLRAVGAARALNAGIPASAIGISASCTRCDPHRPYWSHRAGEAGRQMAVLAIRPD